MDQRCCRGCLKVNSPSTPLLGSRANQDEGWELYIAAPGVNQTGKRDPYMTIQDTIRAHPDWTIGLLDVKVVDSSSEVGQSMIELANRTPPKPTFCYDT